MNINNFIRSIIMLTTLSHQNKRIRTIYENFNNYTAGNKTGWGDIITLLITIDPA